MARKPRETTVEQHIVTESDTPGLPAMVAAHDALATAQVNYAQERDLANQVLGEARATGMIEDFSRTVRISKLTFIKENKLYRSLKGSKSPDGAELSGTWEEYCGLLNRSTDQVDRDISNLKVFGEQALESMTRMGIGYRDLHKMRNLPADQRQIIIGEVEANADDKEAIIALIEDIVTKHTKEKIALEQEVQTLRDDAEANERVIEGKNRKIDQLDKALHRRENLDGHELNAELARELEDETLAVIASILGMERAVSQITSHAEAPQDLLDARAYAIRRILTRLQELEADYNIAAVGPADDGWMHYVPGVVQPQAD